MFAHHNAPFYDAFCRFLPQGKKDYMGLAIKNDNLVYVYNLGGEDVEIPLGSKPVSQWPAVFNYIKVERYYAFMSLRC